MKINILILLISSIIISSCSPSNTDEQVLKSNKVYSLHPNSYAKGFELQLSGQTIKVTVLNPWQGATGKEFVYSLSGSDGAIGVPIKRAVCMSTGHIAMLDKLGEAGSIVGVSGNYVYNSVVRNKLRTGQVVDVGYGSSINYELLVSLSPDVIFLYGVGQEVSTTVSKLEQLGLNVVLVGEYLEQTPLASAEWLKFFAAFYGKIQLADSLFTEIEAEYIQIKKLASKTSSKPTVFTGLPWEDVWYVPGGQSFAAQYIADAGGEYIWHSDTSRQALPLSLEVVLSEASEADIWINPGAATDLAFVQNIDERMVYFKAFRQAKLFNNNNKLSPNGGNDYWESGLVSPQLILADILNVLHPDITPHHKLFYYKQLQ